MKSSRPSEKPQALAPVIDRLQALLSEDISAVEQLLAARAASPVAMIPDLSGYIVGAGGKRLASTGHAGFGTCSWRRE